MQSLGRFLGFRASSFVIEYFILVLEGSRPGPSFLGLGLGYSSPVHLEGFTPNDSHV